MSKNISKLTRRDFLLKTGSATAGAVFTSTFFAHAFTEKRPLINNPKIAIILDDVGYNMSYILPFLELNVPITFSILPRIHYSRRLARMINDEGHEIMLHQPMEPHNILLNPGPGTLYLNQNIEELQEIIEENIISFPFSVGINNHMGSLFTESKQKILDALKVFKSKEFFFIDSITSRNSQAFITAKNMNMKTSCRNIFLDNQNNKYSICRQLAKLKKHALKFGSAIGIAHPRPETASAMSEFFYSGEAEGFSVEYISGILDIS